jgi:acetylornithine deacetylase/succinyl-diaminopimelate desuccinylase-like protein
VNGVPGVALRVRESATFALSRALSHLDIKMMPPVMLYARTLASVPRASLRLLAGVALTAGSFANALPAQAPATALNPTAALLVELIRVNTSNPPGNEGQLDDLLAPKFKALGFEVEIFPTPVAGKSHFIARLRGDGSRKPLLMAAHGDVVGVEREKWTVDPFAGVIKDGNVYGRGAIDFKGGMAVFARAAMMLAEQKIPLARDIIFLVEADEEGAQYNTGWLARDHFDRMDAEFALNEGGWIIKDRVGKTQYVSISTADKMTMSVVLTAHGTSTHSSMPRSDNAIFTLSKAMTKISGYETAVQLTASTRQFFNTLAAVSAPPLAGAYRNLVNGTPAQQHSADVLISRDPLMHAIMRNTYAPVLMNAGFRSNVIPGTAEATLNVRMIPGTTTASIIAELTRVVNDPNVDIKSAGPAGASVDAAPVVLESSTDTELYKALEREAKVTYPGARVTPYLFQAGTDAAAWRSRGIPVYGIYPYAISADELTRMHGNDERVSIAALQEGTDMIFRTLVSVAGKH